MRKSDVFIRQRTYTAVLYLLNLIISGKKYPDRVIGELFRNEDFSSDEKAHVVEFTYGILRNLGRLDYIIVHSSRANIPNLDPEILNSLRISTYQALFSGSTDTAILNNATALSSKNTGLTGFVKRTVEAILRNKNSVIFPEASIEYISAYHSHPRWIVEKWVNELGSINEAGSLCQSNNIEPPLTARVNPLKNDIESLQKTLGKEGYTATRTAFSPYGLEVDKKENIFKTGAFREGKFEVQDEGSQLVTMLSGAKPGEVVIDACAGNGGKTLFLSGLMKNRGTVIASDASLIKLENLRKRAGKAGAFNIMTASPDKLNEHMADCVLIDAPCSGMGIFRRNPDSKWRLVPEDIKELAAKQKEIMSGYSRLVKPGGRLVYVTCTICMEENENVIVDFLRENEDFNQIPVSSLNHDLFGRFEDKDGFFRSFPHVHGTDGFFGAVMKRKK